MNRKNIDSTKVAEDKPGISFFENVIYWIWYYSRKTEAMYPWMFGVSITSMLKFSNTAIIAFTVFRITNINNEKTMALIVASLFIIILIADMVQYDSNKYTCYIEKHCILASGYDNMTRGQKQRYKRTFLIYLTLSTVTGILFLCSLLL
jgi:uncharacterized membrane protein YdbT with pleckstrin-like domain